MGWIYGLVAKLFTKTIWHFSFTVIVEPNIIPVVMALLYGCAQVKVPDTNCCCGGVLLVAGTLKPAERETGLCWSNDFSANIATSNHAPSAGESRLQTWERREAVGLAISMLNVTPRNRTESAWTISLRRSEKLVEFVKLDWSKAYKHFSQPWPWAISNGQSANVIAFPRWIHGV